MLLVLLLLLLQGHDELRLDHMAHLEGVASMAGRAHIRDQLDHRVLRRRGSGGHDSDGPPSRHRTVAVVPASPASNGSLLVCYIEVVRAGENGQDGDRDATNDPRLA